MFVVVWSDEAFEQMQNLFDRHPALQTEFTYFLRTLARELASFGNEWGESRDDSIRIGFIGPVTITIDVDESDSTIEVLSVKLTRRTPPQP